MSDVEDRYAKITDEAIDSLRRLIGVEITDTVEPWCYEATRDNIRHYAHGIGDDNPLWCDPSYARGTAYGDVIAPPSFVFALNRILSGYVGGLPGIHAMWAGADLTWHRPIVRNAAIRTTAHLKDSRRARHPLRRAGDPADLPRRHPRRSGCVAVQRRLVVLPHRTGHGARGGHEVRRDQVPSGDALHRRGPARDSRPVRGEPPPRRAGARHRRRRRRRRVAGDAEGPDDRHRVHRLRPGLGWPVHPGQQAGLRAAQEAPGVGHPQRQGHPRRAGTGPLGGRPGPRRRHARAPTTTGPSAARGSPSTSPTGPATTPSSNATRARSATTTWSATGCASPAPSSPRTTTG